VLLGDNTLAQRSAWAGSKGFATEGRPETDNSIGLLASVLEIILNEMVSANAAGENWIEIVDTKAKVAMAAIAALTFSM
jgi:hypothetical protein